MNMGQQKHVKCAGCGVTAFLGRKDWREELRQMRWTVRGSAMYHCSQCTADRAKEDREYKKLAKSGARRSLIPGQVLEELKRGDDQKTPRYEPVTPLGYANDARFLMSSKLVIRDELRAVGNYYGGSVQLAELGHGNTFAQEAVDGGKHGAGGGVTPAMIEARQIADVAQRCMKDLPVIRHRANSRKFKMGAHRNILARQLVDAICIHQFEITEVAMRFGWWAQRSDTGTQFIPKQQSQKLKAALVDALEAIDEAFQEFGIDAQRIGVVRVR